MAHDDREIKIIKKEEIEILEMSQFEAFAFLIRLLINW